MDFLCCDIYSRCKRCSTVTDSGIGKENFDFGGCLSGKVFGQSGKKSINWHTGCLGEKDANRDLVGEWAQYVDKEQFG